MYRQFHVMWPPLQIFWIRYWGSLPYVFVKSSDPHPANRSNLFLPPPNPPPFIPPPLREGRYSKHSSVVFTFRLDLRRRSQHFVGSSNLLGPTTPHSPQSILEENDTVSKANENLKKRVTTEKESRPMLAQFRRHTVAIHLFGFVVLFLFVCLFTGCDSRL